MTIARVTQQSGEILASLARVIVGKADVLERILAGILANGHVLIEDYPGLAKTLIARLFAQALISVKAALEEEERRASAA